MDTPSETFPSKSYALSGKIMITAIIILFSVMILIVFLHLYARWFLRRPRHVTAHRIRHRNVIFYSSESHLPSPKGLDAVVLASLPVLEYAPEKEFMLLECAVCLSEFETGEKVRFLPKCGHGFHVECIDMWFHNHDTCPVCRSLVEKIDKDFTFAGRIRPDLCHSHATVEKFDLELGLPSRVEPESSSAVCASCPICRSPVEKLENNFDLAGRVKTASGSGLCHSNATVEKINVEFGLPGQVESGSRTGPCVTCHSMSTLGDRRWGNGKVRIEVPRRTEFESKSGASSPANQGSRTPGSRILSVKRILSMGKRSVAVSPSGPSCDLDKLDLECGVNESTQHQSRAHTPS